MVYKMITSGQDPYNALPIATFANSYSLNSNFYHGYIKANPTVIWNYNLSTTNIGSLEYDFYGSMAHELVHLLGFNSLISSDGSSSFGIINNYYSRYDQFLHDFNGAPLLTNLTSACPYTLTFNSSLTPSTSLSQSLCLASGQDLTTCSVAASYSSSSSNVKVYTPFCWENGSSLSHFEDICTFGSFTTTCVPTPTNGYNNLYFLMSEFAKPGPCYVKRYLKDQEKLVLCDLGYSVNLTYTSSAANATHSYAAACSPTNVIGLNDGYTGNVFTYTTSTATFTQTFSNILSNDLPTGVLQVGCLEMVYNNGTVAQGLTDFTVTATVGAGLVLLKYYPEFGTQIGNATYIYVYFNPPGCSPTYTCNLVQNPGFEILDAGNPACGFVNGIPGPPPFVPITLCGWRIYQDNYTLLNNTCTANGHFQLGVNTLQTPSPVSSYNGAVGNDNVVCLRSHTFYASAIKNQLPNPLINGQPYRISFWAQNSPASITANLGPINPNNVPVIISVASYSTFYLMPFLSFPAGLDPIINFTINPTNTWALYTNTFVFSGPTSNALFFGLNSSNSANAPIIYGIPPTSSLSFLNCFIDDVSIEALPSPTFVLPPVPSCGIATYTDLAQYASVAGVFSGVGVTFINGLQYDFNNPSTFTAGSYPIAFTYTANGCVNTIWQIVTQNQISFGNSGNTTICTTTGGSSATISAQQTSSISGLTFTWQPGNLSGPTQVVSPTVTTVYTVTAYNSTICSLSQTLTVAVYSNCCGSASLAAFSQPTVTPNSTLPPGLVTSDFTVQAGVFSITGDVKFLSNVKVTVAPNATLQVYDSHLSACAADMWQGIVVQDGGKLVTYNVTSDNLIEDAIKAIDVTNHTTSTLTTILDLKNTSFNKNFIDLNIVNYQRTSTTYNDAFKIRNCVFSCRNFTANASQWPSTSTSDLRSETSSATGLASPYLGNNASATLLSPYAGQTSNIAINLDGVGIASGGNYNGITIGTITAGEFNLFDNHVTFIKGLNCNVHSINNVFQNTQNSASVPGNGSAIYCVTTGSLTNNYLDLTSNGSAATGNRFWNCHRGVEGRNLYAFHINYSLFRSTQSTTSSVSAFLPGHTGIVLNTNRLRYFFTKNEFTNVKYGIVVLLGAGPTTLVPTTNYGIYASNIAVVENIFSRGSGSNTYMDKAVDVSAFNAGTWAIGSYTTIAPNTIGVIAAANTLTAVHRGIYINGLIGFPVEVYLNHISLTEDLNASGNAQHGIHLSNTFATALGQSSIYHNDLRCIGTNSVSNNLASLIYCGINVGPSLQSPSVTCNSLRDSYHGFYYESDNQGGRWVGNSMENHINGLAMQGYAWIGTQGSTASGMGNFWNGTWASGVNYGIYTYTSDAQFSRLYAASSGTPAFPPNLNGMPALSSYANYPPTIISGYASYDCFSPNDFTSNPVLPDPANFDTDNHYYIFQTSMYRFLAVNPAIRDADAALSDYYLGLAGSSIAAFSDIDEALALGDLGTAAALLSGVTATNTVEENYILYYTLYLSYAANNFQPTDSDTDETDLIGLASLCPGNDGACVYQVRALYKYVFKDARAFPPCSEATAERQAGPMAVPHLEIPWDVKLYPNPTTNQVSIVNSVANETISIRICDLSGRMLLVKDLKQNGFLGTLDLDLVNGAYIVYITNNKRGLTIKKLLIAK